MQQGFMCAVTSMSLRQDSHEKKGLEDDELLSKLNSVINLSPGFMTL